nr:reverse transcriptase domain-containing protein [Tanacetum cinerariifolium]
MQLKKQIEELVRARKLSHLIKEIKQGREQPKAGKKETAVKDKPTTIYMIQSWQRTVKQKVIQSFEQAKEIAFPPQASNNETEGPLVIEEEIGGHMIHRMYIDGGSSMEILYEHCFNRLRPEIKSQMIPKATLLTGFCGETIWPLGQLRLLVIIGDATYSTKAWMNFMVVKSLSPYNGIIGRPGLNAIQAVPSTVHGMLKFPIEVGIVTICSTILIPTECASVITSLVIPREEKTRDVSQAFPATKTQKEPWTLFTDGSSCVDGSGAGLILTSPEGVEFTYAMRFQFTASNNEAEYEALVAGLRIAARIGVKNVREKEVAAVIEEDGPNWMTQLVDYLKGGVLPGDKKEARKLCLKARQYELNEGVLYRRSFLTPWLRYVGPLQADYVIREIHEGSFSMHAGPRKAPQQPLTPITVPWPFYKWGIDIASPFLEGPGKVKFLIVTMDYFTKWIEAKAVTTITGGQVKKFVWDNIVCRFGIPGEIISDNGKQFSDNPFKDWCDKLNITQRFASVKHPQSNGLVERAKRSLGKGIKSCLGEGNKNWIEELPHILCAHQTMIKSSHGDTPFSLTYETEAVIPTEIKMPTYRTAVVDVVNNDEELRLNLDVNDGSHMVAGGKLGPKWEGPYEVTETLGNGAYKLRSMDGTILPKMWNIANLKRCYL